MRAWGRMRDRDLGQMPDQVPANLQTLSRLQAMLQSNSDAMNRLEQEKEMLSRLPDPVPSAPTPTRPTAPGVSCSEGLQGS